MNVCVIMVNYNNSQLSCNCCDSLLKQQKSAKLSIVVVDNNSRKEEQDILKAYIQGKENVDGLFLPENIGYFPAMAKGQELAYSKNIDFDYMIVANNDLIYEDNFMEILSTLHFEKDVMVVSPDIIRMDGVHQNPHFINRISPLRKFLYRFYYSNWYVALFLAWVLNTFNIRRHEINKAGYDKEQYIYMGFGACFILTKAYMEQIKMLDTRSFLMGEEQLLTLQLEKVGGKTLYKPVLKVNHMDSATFKTMPSRFAYDCECKSYQLYKDYL